MHSIASKLHEHHFTAMASPCSILCLDRPDFFSQAEAEVRRIEVKYSRFLPQSTLSQINAKAGQWQNLDEETASLLDYAQACFETSAGLFDVSAGVLQQAWPFKETDADKRRPPKAEDLTKLLPLVGFDQIKRSGDELYLPTGMRLDFGGIGKEYAVDRVTTLLQDLGVQDFLVNLGGDLRAVNHSLPPWSIGIIHPRKPGDTIASIKLENAALATSGDYERYLDHEGQRYCHLLNPRTGYPAQQAQSVSVIAPSCMVAGSVSSMAMLSSEPHELLLSMGLDYLLVDALGHLTGATK